ncbi:MAG: DUF4340 domain-containing protein [Oscillospiraceae bacterium]|nr:DUF4340 domain-containing protein [Oscillospiraceae bacterium]
MSKTKRLYILIGVLLAVTAATILAGRHKTHKEEIRASGQTILEIPSDSVTLLSWDCRGKSLVFQNTNGSWKYTDDGNFPVDPQKIADLLAPFQQLVAAFVIENVEDYGQYGLDSPTGTIRITAADTAYEIQLGAFSKMDSQRYLSVGDGRVYLVKEDLLEKFSLELKDLIRNDTLPSLTEAKELRFSGTESYSVVREENSTDSYCADDVYFSDGRPLNTKAVKAYLGVISALNLNDYASYHVSDDELKAFGLHEPELTITVTYQNENGKKEAEEQQLVLHISRNPEELEAAKKKPDEGGEKKISGYVRVGDSQIVYRIGEDAVSALMAASYDDLRHKEVLTAAFEDISRIDVSLDGNSYQLFTEGQGSKKVWHYREGDDLDIARLQKALTGLRAESFTGDAPEQKEEIGLTLHLDQEKHPEMSIRLYRYNGEQCLAVVNGESVSLVPRSSVISLKESIYAIVLD